MMGESGVASHESRVRNILTFSVSQVAKATSQELPLNRDSRLATRDY